MEDFQMDDVMLDNKKKKSCRGLLIKIFILLFILIAIAIIVVIIIRSKKGNEEPKKEQKEYYDFKLNSLKYFKYLSKLAITEERIKHLLTNKTSNEVDYFDDLIQLEKLILKIGWNQMKIHNQYKEILEKSDILVKNYLNLPKGENITIKLLELMLGDDNSAKLTQNNLNEDEDIQKINSLIQKNETLIISKLNSILLYTIINLPMQLGFFSSQQNYKKLFLEEITKNIKSTSPHNQILNNINQDMTKYENKKFFMVLGAGQGEEFNRISAISPYINICNTGIRTQLTNAEIKGYLLDNIENYYTNNSFRKIIEQSTLSGEMDDNIYNNFIEDCNILKNNLTQINALETFGKYNFSVETANTVIEYMKLNYTLDNIIIIRLGENDPNNKNINYNENKAYVLFNIIDISETFYSVNGGEYYIPIKRATTEANAKLIIYLMNECPLFIDDYSQLVLVSNKGNAERQLEAFNIIFNIFNYNIQLNYVIWNEKLAEIFTNEDIINTLTEIFVKSMNLIASSFQQLYINEYEKNKTEFLNNIINFIDNITILTNNAKSGKIS